jgi:hypothetical protein
MAEPEDDDPFTIMVDALVQTQGSAHAVYHILLELVIRLAHRQPDPAGFLKSMYEAISAKLDQTPPETEVKRAHAAERLTISTFFSVAEKTVRNGTRRKDGRAPRLE